ncbi:unnamed protein product [Clonostachys byssicola]|uniref:Uncharacterized protein n=1 Tax=Clonostachys byssicola TaxID=160290 RepID=A0A9N9UZJ3_9HYPO|nr:unnamed protein product [Clonostachys byssicola]
MSDLEDVPSRCTYGKPGGFCAHPRRGKAHSWGSNAWTWVRYYEICSSPSERQKAARDAGIVEANVAKCLEDAEPSSDSRAIASQIIAKAVDSSAALQAVKTSQVGNDSNPNLAMHLPSPQDLSMRQKVST